MGLHKVMLLILMLSLAPTAKSQNAFGVGISTVIFPGSNPGLPLTPYLFYQHNKHEFLIGADIYGGQLGFASIIGAEIEYRYHFYNLSKNLDAFADINILYVRFANGPARSVPFNYSEPITPNGLNYSMMKVRVLNNTAGIGLRYSFWQRCSVFFNAGVGGHYQRNTITEGVSASLVNQSLLGTQFKFGWIGKFGLAVTLVGKRNKH